MPQEKTRVTSRKLFSEANTRRKTCIDATRLISRREAKVEKVPEPEGLIEVETEAF